MLTKKHPQLATGGIVDRASSKTDPITPSPVVATIEPLATIESWAAALVVSVPTIERLRRAGRIPQADVMIGRLPRWKCSTIRRWIETGGAK